MNKTPEEKLQKIIELLQEKNYDPIAQLTGYIKYGDAACITRHGGARDMIREIPEDIIEKYLREN